MVELEEHGNRIKGLAVAMIDLAVADYTGTRGGTNAKYWRISAERWLNNVRPGDECNPVTFLGACVCIGWDPIETRKSILGMNATHRTSHYVGKHNKINHRYPNRTYIIGCARLEWQCEYCGQWIRQGEKHCYRHLTGKAMRAHIECVNNQKDYKVTIKEGYVSRKKQIEKSRSRREAKSDQPCVNYGSDRERGPQRSSETVTLAASAV